MLSVHRTLVSVCTVQDICVHCSQTNMLCPWEMSLNGVFEQCLCALSMCSISNSILVTFEQFLLTS